MTTVKDFYNWVCIAPHGSSIEYYRGVLATAAEKPYDSDKAMTAYNIRMICHRLQSIGYIILVSKKYGEDDYGYIAIRTSIAGEPPYWVKRMVERLPQ
jgi:hypothetical protein